MNRLYLALALVCATAPSYAQSTPGTLVRDPDDSRLSAPRPAARATTSPGADPLATSAGLQALPPEPPARWRFPTSAGAPRLTVHVGGTARTVDCREGETVLDAALRTGLVPPFACQVGVCASCKATVTRGRVQMLRHEALTPLDVDQRCVLTCTAVPVSDEVVVRYG